MSEVKCPFCGVELFPGDLREGECSSCLQRLPPPRADDYRREGLSPAGWGPAGIRDASGWRTMKTGLDLLCVSLAILVVCLFVVGSTAILEEMLGGVWGGGDPVVLARVLIVFGGGIGLVLGLVGYGLCAVVPQRSGLRSWVVGYVVTLGLAVLLVLGGFLLLVVADGSSWRELGYLGGLAILGGVINALASWVLFQLYLRAIARLFGAEGLAAGFLVYLVVSSVLLVFSVLGVLAIDVLRIHPPGREFEMLWSCGSTVVVVALMVWMFIMLYRLRRVIVSPGRTWEQMI